MGLGTRDRGAPGLFVETAKEDSLERVFGMLHVDVKVSASE